MRYIVLFALFWSSVSFAAPTIPELRALYYRAAEDKPAAKQLYEHLKDITPVSPPLLVCYKGVSIMMLANHTINPYRKYNYFKKGKELVESSLASEPGNLEARFIRYCIQTNIPSFLGYSNEVKGDKEYLLNNWNKTPDNDLKEKIKQYLRIK